MKKVTLLILFSFLLSDYSYAQWSVSAKFGLSGYQGDLHCRTDEDISMLEEIGLSFGLGARYAINSQFGVRGEAALVRLSGNENNFSDAQHDSRGWGFKHNFLELAAIADYEIFGKRVYGTDGTFKNVITPVVFAGVGMVFSRADVDWNNTSTTNTNIETDEEKGGNITLAIPVGVGVKYYLSEQFCIGAEFGLRLPVSDYYDGVSKAGNPDENDSYAFGGLKAFFIIGN